MEADSIIFDLDGTLWDSTQRCAEAWNESLKRHGLPCEEITGARLQTLFGRPLYDIGKAVLPETLSEEEFLRILNICCEEQNPYLKKHPGTLFPHVAETLETLSKAYPLFIVSNCQKGYIETFLEITGFSKYITDTENPGRTGLSKAENILLIAKRNSLHNPVYVGDTTGDAAASKKAGLPFIYASYGFGAVSDYDEIIHNFSELNHLFMKELS